MTETEMDIEVFAHVSELAERFTRARVEYVMNVTELDVSKRFGIMVSTANLFPAFHVLNCNGYISLELPNNLNTQDVLEYTEFMLPLKVKPTLIGDIDKETGCVKKMVWLF